MLAGALHRNSKRLYPALEQDSLVPLHPLRRGRFKWHSGGLESDEQVVIAWQRSANAERKIYVDFRQHLARLSLRRRLRKVHQVHDAIQVQFTIGSFLGATAKKSVLQVRIVYGSRQPIAPDIEYSGPDSITGSNCNAGGDAGL